MKKFFALLMVAVMTMAMASLAFADGEVVLRSEADGKGSFDLSGCADDGKVIVTIKYTAEAVEKGVNAGWGVGSLCDSAWTNLDAYGFNAGGDAVEGGTFTLEYSVAALKADNVCVANAWNGCVVAGVVYVPAAAPGGDATPVAAMAIIAMVSCAAVVVLRKKEA